MRNFPAAAVILMASGLSLVANAQVVKQGGEFQVNTFTSGHQENPKLATDAKGNFVVVWTRRNDGDVDSVAAQRFSSLGANLGTEFVVNTYTTSSQSVPAVAVKPNGDFVVIWESHGQDGELGGIFGQRFNSSGAQVGTEFQINTFTSSDQANPAIAIDPVGNFVVVWEGPSFPGDNDVIAGQRYDGTGAKVGTEFVVSSIDDNDKEKVAVAMDATGNFVVVWENHNFGNLEDVVAQRYDNTGAKVGTEFQVNTFTSGAQEHAAIAMDSAGNFVVVWDSRGQHDGSREGIFGQRFNSSGATVGTEFQANTYTTNEQEDPSVALDTAGNFVVTWYSGACGSDGGGCHGTGQDGDLDGAFGQRFSSSGAPLGTEFQINTYTTGDQTGPKVVAQPGGNFVVAWQGGNDEDGDDDGIFAQRFGAFHNLAPTMSTAGLALAAAGLLVAGIVALTLRARRGS